MSAGLTQIKACFPDYEILEEGTVAHGDSEYWLVKTNNEEVPYVTLLKGFPGGEPTMEVLMGMFAENIGATPTGIVDKHGNICSLNQREIDNNVMKWDDEYLMAAVTLQFEEKSY